MTETPPSADADAGDAGDAADGHRPSLRDRFPDPSLFAVLGFLSVPGYLSDSLSPLRVFALCFLFALWPLVRTALPTPDDGSPTDWVEGGTPSMWPVYVSIAYQQLNPFVQLQGLRQLAGHVPILLRYRGRLPRPDRYEQSTSFRLPFDGEWTVIGGSTERAQSHSWDILTQRYAYDFVITDEAGRTHTGDGSSPEDYYCFGEPVVAPADGVVVAASDGHRDYHRAGGWLDPTQRDIRGNWLTIEHDGGEYSVLAHLQQGSVAVSAGDRVERGQQVGRCGHSGNSTEPHLHAHVQDRPGFFRGMGLPVAFDDVTTRVGLSDERTAHGRTYVTAGQRVEHRTSDENSETDADADTDP